MRRGTHEVLVDRLPWDAAVRATVQNLVHTRPPILIARQMAAIGVAIAIAVALHLSHLSHGLLPAHGLSDAMRSGGAR